MFRDTINTMASRTQNNRKWLGWLLTIVMIVLALPSGASWQCLDGTACPSGCPMLQDSRSRMTSCKSPTGQHCALCAPRITAVVISLHHGDTLSCTTPKCVVRVSERPASTMQHGVEFHVPLLALPPPARFAFVINEPSIPASFPIRLPFFPQRFLRPASGRAPPVSL